VADLARGVFNSCEGNKVHDVTKETIDYYDWKTFLHTIFSKKGVPQIQENVLIMEVNKVGGDTQVRLKKDSEDEGYLWESFLGRNITMDTARSKSEDYKNFKLDVLPLSNSRKKYLIENIIEKYYTENDISKAHMLGLETLEEYRNLRADLLKLKVGKEQQ